MQTVASLLLKALLMTLALSGPAMAQQIWFAPRSGQLRGQGPVDWQDLFLPNSPWAGVARNVSVFRFDEGFLETARDSDLRKIVDNLKERHLRIAVGLQSLAYTSPEDCGHGVEGYHYPGEGRIAAEKLKKAGGQLDYILLDGPLWFGRYETKRGACRTSIQDVVRRTTLNVDAVLRSFPTPKSAMLKGSLPLPRNAIGAQTSPKFQRQLALAIGRPIAAIAYDVNWEDPRWQSGMKDMTDFARSLGMKIGIVYNGDVRDKTAKAWIQHAVRNFETVEGTLRIIPDRAIFASWNDFPTHLLPETNDTSMTWLIERYVRYQGRRG